MSIELILLGVTGLGLLTAAGVFGLGLYLGWFNIGPAKAAGKDDFHFTMDADRSQKDRRIVDSNPAEKNP